MKNQTGHGKKDYGVSPEQFITTWQTSSSIDEVCQRLEMPKPIVHARASNYRQAGIKLKKMPRKGVSLDVERLNRLIEDINQKMGQQKKKNE